VTSSLVAADRAAAPGHTLSVVLISTYELGRQPFGLASPAAWLREAGATVITLDLAVQPLDEWAVAAAGLVAVYVPMHTATRLAATLLPRIRRLNPHARLCCYGLYAPLNAPYLRTLGADTIIGGEFEEKLVELAARLSHPPGAPGRIQDTPTTGRRIVPGEDAAGGEHGGSDGVQLAAGAPGDGVEPGPLISLGRQRFRVPAREGLPALTRYAHLTLADGALRTVGYTEATRGCKHLCRHCPIPPVYGGRFRAVQQEVVLEDIARQVAAGARHITFGDPDFFNGPTHALRIAERLHARFPDLTYDATIKVEHLLAHARLLPRLRETGCLFVTSAVEAVDEATLAAYDKRHTRADFVRAAGLCREVGLTLNPTFVTFGPWTTLDSYVDLLALIRQLDLVDAVAPIQYGIRLLIPAGSLLLDLPEVRALVGPYDQEALAYPWAHPDPRVDKLCADVLAAVGRSQKNGKGRREIYRDVWALAQGARGLAGREALALLKVTPVPPGATVPHLSEPWYC
jgi:radical SAM superfamily enzyme YgiQ (UPF0313 family)